MFSFAGHFYSTQAKCTHRRGALNTGQLVGSTVTCPWHGGRFDVCTGAFLRAPQQIRSKPIA